MRSGDSLRFEVDVDTDVPMDDWVVGMGIDTPGGQVVFGTNTMMLGAGDETLDGPKRVVFELPDLQLGTGHYLLHASFGTSEQNTMIHVSDAARLEVYQERRSVGQVAIDVSYEVS